MESVYQQFYQDPRYTPSYSSAAVAAGLLGRKSGQGYYRYDNGQQMRTPAPALEPVRWTARSGWTARTPSCAVGWQPCWARRVRSWSRVTPSERAICLITPLGEDASSMIARLGLPAARCVAYDLFSDRERRHVLMRTPALDPALEAQARQALGGDGVPVEVINDSPGFVSQRVVASIVNLGCEIAQKGIADPHTLDRALPWRWATRRDRWVSPSIMVRRASSPFSRRCRPAMAVRRATGRAPGCAGGYSSRCP